MKFDLKQTILLSIRYLIFQARISVGFKKIRSYLLDHIY